MKNYWFIAGIILCLCPDIICSQEVVSSGGGSARNSTGTISYTLGEIIINTGTGSSKTLTQGFHQSKITITAIFETGGISINVFPNPTTGMIILKTTGEILKDLEYRLIDTEGKLCLSGKIKDTQTMISLDQFSPSLYFLKVITNGKDVKIFRVVKQ